MSTISLRKVAERAGVSGATVSRVLNGKQEDRIPVETRERVRRVATEMGYSPNPLTQRLLRKQTTQTIGLMLSELRNPFFVEVHECLDRLVSEAGYGAMLNVGMASYGRYEEARRLTSWLVDGALVWALPRVTLDQYLGERARNIPAVHLGHKREDGGDSVVFDLYGAGRQATEHLLERGYQRICFVSNFDPAELLLPYNQIPGFRDTQVRGFQDVCREKGIEGEIVVLDQDLTKQDAGFRIGYEIACRPAAERPDALICHNDWIGQYVYLGLLKCGARVPADVAVVGFDGIEECRHLPDGPMTTIRMPIEDLGRTALDILLRRIAGDAAMPGQQVTIPTKLIVGGTT